MNKIRTPTKIKNIILTVKQTINNLQTNSEAKRRTSSGDIFKELNGYNWKKKKRPRQKQIQFRETKLITRIFVE